MKTLVALLAVMSIALVVACSSHDRAGNGSETTNQVAGTLLLADGAPASAARVSLIGHHGLPDTAEYLATMVTDAEGTFRFEGLALGRYSVQARHEANGTQFLADVDAAPESTWVPMVGTLQLPAVLHFPAQPLPDFLGVVCYLDFGLPGAAQYPSGQDRYDTVPAGIRVIQVRVRDSAGIVERIWAIDTVEAVAGETIEVDTLRPWVPSAVAVDSNTLVVGDFESGDLWNAFGSIWWVFDDRNNGGQSIIRYADADSNGNDSAALHFSYEFGMVAPTFVGCGFVPSDMVPGTVADLMQVDSARFRIRGSGVAHVQVCVSSDLLPTASPNCMDVLDTLPSAWTSFVIPWDLATTAPREVALAKDFTFLLTILDGGTQQGDVWIDDVQWVLKSERIF